MQKSVEYMQSQGDKVFDNPSFASVRTPIQ